ncbi:hypothetical protein [Spirosoma validum]|uniref:Uncharacterized protein n=1 Tax=Spirosoma validum TaxID=2771355 RepID=A0A927B7D7_9BACT|nr:hypothetical protein [Spirosoma validum]MBD2757070.1 hypothetical protein [Spirosoma validum]
MKWLIQLLAGFLLIIFLANFFSPARYALGQFLGRNNSIFSKRQYVTKHGYFAASEGGFFLKGASETWEGVVSRFDRYKQCHPTSPDTVLYRRYQLRPWQFWD